MLRGVGRWLVALLTVLGCLVTACGDGDPARLRLATTTSTHDSGLLDEILPAFEERSGLAVDVIAVGTGQAIALGERGDADVLLVHARSLEERFVADGHGLERVPVMYNDFVVVGPQGDPAGAGDRATAAASLVAIAESGAEFASRGDRSGTHLRELALWKSGEMQPTPDDDPWYLSLGQGMGATLTFAAERGAYTLTDRGTFLAQRDRLGALRIVFGGATSANNPDPSLRNVYSVIAVSPDRHPRVSAEGAKQFVAWLTSADVQRRIATFGANGGEPALFRPAAELHGVEPPR